MYCKLSMSEPAAKYFEGSEVHLFWVCTSKDTENRIQWIIEREPGGYATVWSSRRTFKTKDGTPIDPNLIRDPKELTDLTYTGTASAEVEQCYTPEQALRDGLGLDPAAFYIERAGYYPSVRQLRVRLHGNNPIELDSAHTAKDARALIWKTIRAKDTQKYLTLEEMHSKDNAPVYKTTPFKNLAWIGAPFDDLRFRAGEVGSEMIYDDDDEY